MKSEAMSPCMLAQRKWVAVILVACGMLWPSWAIAVEGTWIKLQQQPTESISTMLLLSDGTVMAQGTADSTWYSLAPDSTGGYTNVPWTSRHPMTYWRKFFSSDVLTNGNVFIAGGEYGPGTTNAEIYNPVNNSWSGVPIPAGIIDTNVTIDTNENDANVGGFCDSGSVLLSNGKVLVLPVYPAPHVGTVTYDPATGDWSPSQLENHQTSEDEASTVKLPDDSILVTDGDDFSSQRYIPALNQWILDTNIPVPLFDIYGDEEGAAFMLPNGRAFYLGSTTNTALYTPSGNTNFGYWNPGPPIPNGLGAPDAPAAMMNNGKILCALSPTPYNLDGTNYVFTSPTYFYEYDYSAGTNGAFTQIHAPNGSYTNSGPTWHDFMLDLPDGTVLFSDGNPSEVYVYVPAPSALVSGKPSIQSVSWNADGSLHLTGTLFNGISQGAAYGDDAQMDSNYPLVRFTDSSGNVAYGRTYNWSSTSVQTGSKLVSTECNVPANVYNGPAVYSLQVVANGNASDPVTFYGPVWVDFNYSKSSPQLGTFANPYSTLGQGVTNVTSGGTIWIKPGASTETLYIAKAMKINAIGGTATVGE